MKDGIMPSPEPIPVLLNDMNAGEILWSHAVNSQLKLNTWIKSPIHIIESDIQRSSEGVIVCAHPPETDSDLTVFELIQKVSETDKGLKLDFKNPDTVEDTLQYLNYLNLNRPVLLNTDILTGNGAAVSKFEAEEFIMICSQQFPRGILSLGWTTVPDPNFPYTDKEILSMLELTTGLSGITFPVRACLLPNSWHVLKTVLKNPTYTLSIWNNEPVDPELLLWIKANTDPARTFYDFIDENNESIRL